MAKKFSTSPSSLKGKDNSMFVEVENDVGREYETELNFGLIFKRCSVAMGSCRFYLRTTPLLQILSKPNNARGEVSTALLLAEFIAFESLRMRTYQWFVVLNFLTWKFSLSYLCTFSLDTK